ncbi:MAG: DNA polymerase/3'-5' exonuclease PolX [Chitinophagia bacterium]|nr:DNA polymerase/3'-5' exonuclease PolX [Chitinophagia bacterium]
MLNTVIADRFTLLAQLMELHGEDPFRIKTYTNVAYTIEKLPTEVTEMTDADLFGVKGIGASTGKKIRELLATGSMGALEDVLQKTPPGLLKLLQVKGLGAKKVAVIWHELGIESLPELEYACNENRLVTLKGFGAKTQSAILESINFLIQSEGFWLYAEAKQLSDELIEALKTQFPYELWQPTGAVRRQEDTLAQLDILTTCSLSLLHAHYAKMEGYTLVEGQGCLLVAQPQYPKVNIISVSKEIYYRQWFVTTCTDDFLASFTAKYKLPDAIDAEEDIFKANGIDYIPAAMRNGVFFAFELNDKPLPKLIEVADIKGVIHSHSTWSDGSHTLLEMAEGAKKRGLQYLVITDHSQTAVYANGLKLERVAEQHAEIERLNRQLAPFKILKGIESDILVDGNLDYTPEVLQTFDVVIASVHSGFKMDEERATQRLITAIANPYTTILGHPTGRILLGRAGYPINHKAIIDACAIHNVVIEINANPHRLDLDWTWVTYAMQKGVLLSINPDAHHINGIDDIKWGVAAAQKAGLTAACNLSSFTLEELEVYLAKRRF